MQLSQTWGRPHSGKAPESTQALRNKNGFSKKHEVIFESLFLTFIYVSYFQKF